MLEGIGESVMSLDDGLVNKYRSIYAYMPLISTIKYFFESFNFKKGRRLKKEKGK